MDRLVLAQLTQLYMTVKLECPFYGVNMHCFYWPIDDMTLLLNMVDKIYCTGTMNIRDRLYVNLREIFNSCDGDTIDIISVE